MTRSRWIKLDQVICRQESRPDERPLKYRRGGDWVEIEAILSTHLERGPGEQDPTYRVFEVRTANGPRVIRIAVDAWVWELQEPPGS